VSPSSVEYALESEGLKETAKTFVDDWRKNHQADAEFLAKMGKALQVDAVLIGRGGASGSRTRWTRARNAAAASYVGATVTIFSTKDGSVALEATDEDMLEGIREKIATAISYGAGRVRSTAIRRALCSRPRRSMRSRSRWPKRSPAAYPRGSGPRAGCNAARSGMKDDRYWMERAIEEAEKALLEGEVPVGAVVVTRAR